MASEVCMDKAMCKSQTARSPGPGPGSLYSCDFGDPVFCLRKFTTCLTLAVQVQFSKHVKCKMSECKVEDQVQRGLCEIEVLQKWVIERQLSHEPQPEEKAKGTDR